MKELLIILAKQMPFELLLEKLQEATLAVKVSETKETKSELNMYCTMIAMRLSSEGKESLDVINELSRSEKILGHFVESQKPG